MSWVFGDDGRPPRGGDASEPEDGLSSWRWVAGPCEGRSLSRCVCAPQGAPGGLQAGASGREEAEGRAAAGGR